MAKAKTKAKSGFNLSEIKTLNPDELKAKSLDLYKEQFNLLMQLKTNQLQNTSEIRRIRRNIARVKTVLHQKNLGAN